MADVDSGTEDEALMLKIYCRHLQRWKRRYLLRVNACDMLLYHLLRVSACELDALFVSACSI